MAPSSSGLAGSPDYTSPMKRGGLSAGKAPLGVWWPSAASCTRRSCSAPYSLWLGSWRGWIAATASAAPFSLPAALITAIVLAVLIGWLIVARRRGR